MLLQDLRHTDRPVAVLLLKLGVLCTGIAYWLFFRLIQRVGPARASTTTYLVPIFGVAWGWLLLGEMPTLTMVASAVLILGSVILSQREPKRS